MCIQKKTNCIYKYFFHFYSIWSKNVYIVAIMWKSNSFIINLILDLKCLLFIQCTVLQYQIYSKWPCDTFIWQLWSTLKIVILIFVLGLSLSQSSKLPWSSPFKQPGITDGGVPVKEFLPVFLYLFCAQKSKPFFGRKKIAQ